MCIMGIMRGEKWGEKSCPLYVLCVILAWIGDGNTDDSGMNTLVGWKTCLSQYSKDTSIAIGYKK